MERVPRTGTSVYHQPPPRTFLLPVVTSTPAEPELTEGLSTVVHDVLHCHVVTVNEAHMALFVQVM